MTDNNTTQQSITAWQLINFQSLCFSTMAEQVGNAHIKVGIDGYGNFVVVINGKEEHFGSDADAAATYYNINTQKS